MESLPIREVVRLVVLDELEQVVMIHAQDRGNPAFGTSWELPGGGIEPGETLTEAALRELREETGLVIPAAAVPSPTWRRDVIYTYRGIRRLHHERISVVHIHGSAPATDASGRAAFEVDDLGEIRWWSVTQMRESAERFYPRSLPDVLPRLLVGEQIDEPLEVWP